MMLDKLRNSLATLMCLHAGLNPWHGREVDQLAGEDQAALEASRAPDVNVPMLEASRILMTQQFLDEIAHHDLKRFKRLRRPFDELINTAR